MVDGAVAGADGELVGGGDGGREVSFCGSDGGERVGVPREQGGDGGGQGAAGAVSILGLDTRGVELGLRDAVVDHVGAVGTVEVSALEDDDARAEGVEGAGGGAHIGEGADGRTVEEDLGLGEVGGDDFGEREDFGAQGGDGVGGEQVVSALGDHDGIDDEAGDAVAAEGGGDGRDDFRGAQHPEFDGVDADVGEERVELLRDEGDGHGVDAGDAEGVLGGEGGDDAGAVGAEGGEGFEVGEEAGSAGRIDAGDAEDVGNHAGDRRMRSQSLAHGTHRIHGNRRRGRIGVGPTKHTEDTKIRKKGDRLRGSEWGGTTDEH